ncbi:GMC family oxidoreductase N-terminal domain-containing protein [Cupriavidus basilensis]
MTDFGELTTASSSLALAPAGCVLARRLSRGPGHACAAVVEGAGPPADDFWIRTPAGMGRLFRPSVTTGASRPEPVPTLRDRRIYWPRGKTLGKARLSAINGMVYVRGHARDFDHWRDLGNPGWAWDDVLPYCRRSVCRTRRRRWRFARAIDGERPVSPSSRRTGFRRGRAALAPWRAWVRDFNEGEHGRAWEVLHVPRSATACGNLPMTRSWHPALSDVGRTLTYGLARMCARSCSTVLRRPVSRPRIDGQIQRFQVAREVVLCAGALSSPHPARTVWHRRWRATAAAWYRDRGALAGRGVRDLPGDHFAVRVQAADHARWFPTIQHRQAGQQVCPPGALYLH